MPAYTDIVLMLYNFSVLGCSYYCPLLMPLLMCTLSMLSECLNKAFLVCLMYVLEVMFMSVWIHV